MRRTGVALGVAILVAAGATAAAAPASEPWISMHKALRGMQYSVKNVETVLSQGAQNLAPAPGKTWFQACCAFNIEQVRSGAADLRRGFDHLEAQYAKLRDLKAVGALQEMRRHVDEIETIFVNLGNSTNPRDARNRLQAIVHPFNHVRKDTEALEACCPVEPPSAESNP